MFVNGAALGAMFRFLTILEALTIATLAAQAVWLVRLARERMKKTVLFIGFVPLFGFHAVELARRPAGRGRALIRLTLPPPLLTVLAAVAISTYQHGALLTAARWPWQTWLAWLVLMTVVYLAIVLVAPVLSPAHGRWTEAIIMAASTAILAGLIW